MKELLQTPKRRKLPLLAAAVLWVVCIGAVDYLTGIQLFFSVFYLLGVAVAAWYLGKGLGAAVSILSVALWIAGDMAAGARYSNPLVPIWNALILLVFYF